MRPAELLRSSTFRLALGVRTIAAWLVQTNRNVRHTGFTGILNTIFVQIRKHKVTNGRRGGAVQFEYPYGSTIATAVIVPYRAN